MEKMSKTSGKNMEKGLFDSPDTKVQLEKLSQSLKNGQKEMLEKAIKNKSEKDVTKILDELNKGPMKNNKDVISLSEKVYSNEALNQKGLFRNVIDTALWPAKKIWQGVKWGWSKPWIRYPLLIAAIAGGGFYLWQNWHAVMSQLHQFVGQFGAQTAEIGNAAGPVLAPPADPGIVGSADVGSAIGSEGASTLSTLQQGYGNTAVPPPAPTAPPVSTTPNNVPLPPID